MKEWKKVKPWSTWREVYVYTDDEDNVSDQVAVGYLKREKHCSVPHGTGWHFILLDSDGPFYKVKSLEEGKALAVLMYGDQA